MRGKKIMTMAIGGLITLNIAGIVMPDMAAMAEAATYRHEERRPPSEDFKRAIRLEHEKHEKKVHEIQKKYHSHSQMHKLHREMQKERERHEKAMWEINQKYHH